MYSFCHDTFLPPLLYSSIGSVSSFFLSSLISCFFLPAASRDEFGEIVTISLSPPPPRWYRYIIMYRRFTILSPSPSLVVPYHRLSLEQVAITASVLYHDENNWYVTVRPSLWPCYPYRARKLLALVFNKWRPVLVWALEHGALSHTLHQPGEVSCENCGE